MEWKPQSNLYKLHLSRITQQLQNKLRIANNVQILLENMLLNPSTTKCITVPFRDILQSRPITEMLHWNNVLLISQIIYLLSPTWKWNSNTMFQSSYFNIAKKYCDMWHADCYIFLTSDFSSLVNQSVHIKAACWLMLEFCIWLQDNHLQKFYSYSELNIASNNSSDGLEANKTLHALAFFPKIICL